MEKTNAFATLDSCNNNKNGHLRNDALNSSSSARFESGSKSIPLGNGDGVRLNSKMNFLTSFKSELDCIFKQANELETILEQKEVLLGTSNTESEDLQAKINMLTDQVTQLQAAIEHAKALASTEAQLAHEVKESYEAKNAALESQLRETEKNLLEKDSAISELEENVTARVRAVENQLEAKTILLQDSQSLLEDLQAKTDVSMSQVTNLESVVEQLRTAADSEAQRAREIEREYTALVATLRDREGSLQASVVRELRNGFDAKVREFENKLKAKDRLVQSREAELKQKELLLKAKADDTAKLGERLLAEIQKLASELKEKKIALASYEKTQWRSIARRNWWKRIFKGFIFGVSGPSAAPNRFEAHAQTGSFTPTTRVSEEPKNSTAKLLIFGRRRQKTSEPESPLRSKKIVDLTADQLIRLHGS